jgi:hypothetical protein
MDRRRRCTFADRLSGHRGLEQQQQYSAQWLAADHYNKQRAEQCARAKHNWIWRGGAAANDARPL